MRVVFLLKDKDRWRVFNYMVLLKSTYKLSALKCVWQLPFKMGMGFAFRDSLSFENQQMLVVGALRICCQYIEWVFACASARWFS